MFQVVLKDLREKHHLSQAKLAEKLGVAQSTVGMWENGKNKPEYKTLIKIAEFFNVSVNILTGQESEKIPTAISSDGKNKYIGELAKKCSDLSVDELQKVMDFALFLKNQRNSKER